jgi:WD40 repeat protein
MALTLTASETGLEIVDRARKQKGYNKTNAVNWLEAAAVSRSSLDKFWARQPIKHENFVGICAAVGVDWQTVVDITENEDRLRTGAEVSKLEKFNGLKIAKQIHDWLTALRYEFEPYEDFQPEYCEFIIRIPVRRGRFDRILIRGIQSEAKVRDFYALKTSVDSHQTDEGWLIVNRRISPAVQTELAKDENEHLSCMTFDELIDQDADFEPYLTWLEAEVIKRGIDRKYVSLACDKEEIDPVTQHSIATSSYGEAEGWIEGYIKQWLSDDSKEHVSILGEFGTGKTWFSFHYAWECLQAYKQAKEQGLERPRLPLVISLRDYNKALKVESVLSDLFFNKHDIRLNSSVFDCLNQMGKLLIIFDGFDEMADKVDRQKMINNFWELARVVCPGSKVILTSRTEHFPHDRESRQLLNAELESSTAKLKWESPRFELLELAKFNEAQIRQVLTLEAEEKGLSTDIVEKVMVRAELLDLARRPVMTELIIEAMPEIEAGKPVDMSRIYYYAIVRKMDRDIKAERTFTSLADKLYFLCEIAWEMLSTERMKLNYREFPDRIRQIFPQLVTEAKDLDHWHYDMMGQTILIRNADGDYTPAHRSLLEFLVAYKFAAEAGVLKADFVAVMQAQSDCIDGDTMPQDYTWTGYLQAYVVAKIEAIKIAPLQGFISESSEYLRHTFGLEPLTKSVIDLIVPMLEPNNSQPLLDLIRSTKNKTEQETGWLGGNSATLLVKKNLAALDCQDLSFTQMANSDLVGANLQKVDLTGTNLSNSLFKSVLASEVLAITVSQDGKFFVTGHDDSNVRLWDVTTGQLIYIYTGHLSSVNAVAISPDGRLLLSGSNDNTLKRWDITTGDCTQTYLGSRDSNTGHESSVNAVAISPNGRLLLSGSSDNTLKRWDITTGDCTQTYIGHQSWINAVAISPDGQWFVSGSNDNNLKRWDITTGDCIQTYIGHQDWVNAVAISPDGQWFVSGSNDRTIKRWDITTGDCIQTYNGHQDWVNTVAISKDGQWFVSGSRDKTLKRWDMTTGDCFPTYVGHQSSVNAVAISKDGRWLVSGSRDNNLKLWDTLTGKCSHEYTGQKDSVNVVAIAPNGELLVSGSNESTLKRWDITTGDCIQTYIGHQSSVNTVAISKDGQWFVSGSRDNTLKRWDMNTGDCLQSYAGQEFSINAVAIAPDESWLISGNQDKTLKRWNTSTGKCLCLYIGHQSSVNAVAIASDGSWLISGSHDNTLKRWNMITGECVHTYTEHKDWVNTVAISPDNRWFVSGSNDNTLKRWDTSIGDCIHTYTGHQASVTSVAIGIDISWFVSGSNDNTLKRWDTSTGNCIHTYTGHQASVTSVAISFNNHHIISCGGDEIKIWDMMTGECIRTISNQPYEGMRIGDAIGLTSGQIESLKALGAVDN